MEWTGARYADKPTVQVRTWIGAPPARVWELVSDVGLMPAMSTELQSVEWLDGANGPAAGARFAARNRHEALGEWGSTSQVVEFEPERVFGWAVGDPADPAALWRFRLEPKDGGTELSEWVQLGPGRSGLSLAIEQMPDKEQKIVFVRLREFERNMTFTLDRVKALAESLKPQRGPQNSSSQRASRPLAWKTLRTTGAGQAMTGLTPGGSQRAGAGDEPRRRAVDERDPRRLEDQPARPFPADVCQAAGEEVLTGEIEFTAKDHGDRSLGHGHREAWRLRGRLGMHATFPWCAEPTAARRRLLDLHEGAGNMADMSRTAWFSAAL